MALVHLMLAPWMGPCSCCWVRVSQRTGFALFSQRGRKHFLWRTPPYCRRGNVVLRWGWRRSNLKVLWGPIRCWLSLFSVQMQVCLLQLRARILWIVHIKGVIRWYTGGNLLPFELRDLPYLLVLWYGTLCCSLAWNKCGVLVTICLDWGFLICG